MGVRAATPEPAALSIVPLLPEIIHLRRLSPLLVLLAVALPLRAQDTPPSGLQALEAARSRTCVDVLSRLETLDLQLAPLADRVLRLLGIADAVTIEESTVVDSLNASDPIEAAVAEWFRADSALAQRYVSEQSQAILDERAAAKGAIRESLEGALQQVEAEGDSIVTPTGDLRSESVACSTAVLVRGPSIEACEGLRSRVCEAARDSALASPFRFVDSADFLWDRQEFLPWTEPGPLQVSPEGQLAGAQTVGATRAGNVVVSVSFNPMIRIREELSPEELAAFDSIDAVLGIESNHPDVTFAPALAIQVNLARALGDESNYLLHFGPTETPDILWTADADTGSVLGGTVALAPGHVARLRAGEPITLTAVRENDAGEVEGVYAIGLSSVNQAGRVEALLGYMSQQLSADLVRLIQPAN